MNDCNLNPAYYEVLASARGINTAPRLVGEFEGYVDGEPLVSWEDRKNMPQVGDKLFAAPARAAAAGRPARTWSILLTSENHGLVGPLGHPFSHAGEKHERVQVVEIVEAGAPPAPGTDLAGLVRIEERTAVAAGDDDLLEVVRCLCSVAARRAELAPEKRKHYPHVDEEGSPTLMAARAACLARGYTQDGLAVEGVTYPVAARSAPVRGVPSIDTPEFVELLVKVWNGAHPSRGLKSVAALIAHIDQHVASQVRAARDAAIPAGWKLVPENPTEDMVDAGLDQYCCDPDRNEEGRIGDVYRTMLEYVPAPAPAISHSGEGSGERG